MDWVNYYQTEPANFTGGPLAESSGLLGGIEACFWSEFIDSTNLASRAWPRAVAVAERAWSAADVTDLVDAQDRINEFRCKLIDRGIPAEPIGICGNEGCNSDKSPVNTPGYGGFCPREYDINYAKPQMF